MRLETGRDGVGISRYGCVSGRDSRFFVVIDHLCGCLPWSVGFLEDVSGKDLERFQ